MIARLRSHVRHNVVGYVALFVALGGTGAYATHEQIFSSDIVDNEVRSADVRNNDLTGNDIDESSLRSAAFDEESAEVSTQANVYTDLGGPSVPVTVPPSGLVAVFARAEIKGEGSPSGCGLVGLSSPVDFNPPELILANCGPYQKKLTRPGDLGSSVDDQLGGVGLTNRAGAGWLVFEATPGTRTFKLRYRTRHGTDDTASFRNRKLWVLPVG